MSGTNPDQGKDEEAPPSSGTGLPFVAGLPLDMSAFPTGMSTAGWVTGGPLITHPGQEERNDPNFTKEKKTPQKKRSRMKKSKSPSPVPGPSNLLSPYFVPIKPIPIRPSSSEPIPISPTHYIPPIPSKKHPIAKIEPSPPSTPKKRGRPRKARPQPVSPQPSTSRGDHSPRNLGGAVSPNVAVQEVGDVFPVTIELDRLFKMAQESKKVAFAAGLPGTSRQTAQTGPDSPPQSSSSASTEHRGTYDPHAMAALAAAFHNASSQLVDPNRFFSGIQRPPPPPSGSLVQRRYFGDNQIMGFMREPESNEEYYCWAQAAHTIFPNFIQQGTDIMNMHHVVEINPRTDRPVVTSRLTRHFWAMTNAEHRVLVENGALPAGSPDTRLILGSDLEYVLIGLSMSGHRPLYGLGNLDNYLTVEDRRSAYPFAARCRLLGYTTDDNEAQYLYYPTLVGGACLECRECWRLFRPPDAMRHSHTWRPAGARTCLNYNVNKWIHILNAEMDASQTEEAAIIDLYTNCTEYPVTPGLQAQDDFYAAMEPKRQAARRLLRPVNPVIPKRYNGPPRDEFEPREPEPDEPMAVYDD